MLKPITARCFAVLSVALLACIPVTLSGYGPVSAISCAFVALLVGAVAVLIDPEV